MCDASQCSKHIYTHYIFNAAHDHILTWPTSHGDKTCLWTVTLAVGRMKQERRWGRMITLKDWCCQAILRELPWWPSNVSKPKSLHLPWLSVNTPRPLLTLKETESMLGHSPLGAAKNYQTKAFLPCTCVTPLVKHGN